MKLLLVGLTCVIFFFGSFVHLKSYNQQDEDLSSCGDCLILTSYLESNGVHEARRRSEVNPPFLGIKSHSGYITVNKTYNSNLFFWFFPNENLHAPWIIWLQGGPGFSSLLGLFELIGPLKFENLKVQRRNISWTEGYSLLFLDNPVGAGFSFTGSDEGYTDNANDVGVQLYSFLQQFLDIFPELRQAPLFIAGESYAGKYVPALGIHIHRNRYMERQINLKGLAIGNGLIDPHSMLHYSVLCEILGLVEGESLKTLKNLEEKTADLIDMKAMVDAANQFNKTIEFIKTVTGVSVYNFNEFENKMNTDFENFITSQEIRSIIHAGNSTFDLNNQYVYQKMLPDVMDTTKPWIEELLEYYGVMCYSGQLDIILAYGLSMNLYKNLTWSRSDMYLKAPRTKGHLTPDGAVIWFKKSGGNFVDVLVRGAGHMVPVDQPEIAKHMIDMFIRDFR